MNTGQKKLLLWSLIVGAIGLHVLFCEWFFGDLPRQTPGVLSDVPGYPGLAALGERAAKARFYEDFQFEQIMGSDTIGVCVDRKVSGSFLVGILLGIVAPIVLLLSAKFLQVGWFPGAIHNHLIRLQNPAGGITASADAHKTVSGERSTADKRAESDQ